MKILFTSHRFWPDIGGIEVNTEILATHFVRSGHEVRLVTQTEFATGSQKPVHFLFNIHRRPSLAELLRLHYWADVVYQNNIELSSLWPALFLCRPFVVSLRTWLRDAAGRRRPVDRLKQAMLNFASDVIAVSDAIRRDSWSAAKVIGNPYRESVFHERSDVVRNQALAFCGRLVSDKGADMAIEALASLAADEELILSLQAQQIYLSLTLFGDGPERQSLEAQAHRLGVGSRVSFTGPLVGEPLGRQLNAHQILLIPSRWAEPFGNVALEGSACGCIPLGSDAGGLTDAIGPCGLVFRRNDLDHLVAQLRRLLLDAALRQKLRSKAPIHLAAHRPDVVADRYLKIIEACG